MYLPYFKIEILMLSFEQLGPGFVANPVDPD